MQPSELCIVAAYTSQGKSQFLCQAAWHAAVVQGKSVYFATTETIRNTTMRRILSRHSRLPQFGIPNGLNVSDIKNGTLTADEKEAFFDVVRDFTTNSNYATCYIAQMPRNATLNYLDRSVSRVNRQISQIDLVAVDYLQLYRSLKSRQSEREEFNELLRDAKVWCSTFDKGRGVPFITPWQMRQEEWKNAVKSNGYTLASLADTSESEKSADMIISILRPTPTANEAYLQVLKDRDGPLMGPQQVHLDYRNSYIGSVATPSNALDQGNIFDAAGLLM
jgi:replicative DNA helicase